MNDLKLFGKSKEQTNSLIQTVHNFSHDIGVQFEIKKCGLVILERGKVTKIDGNKLSGGQEKDIDENENTYFGIVEIDKDQGERN